MTGDTSGDIAIDEFVLIDEEFVLREGDQIDGLTIAGSIESAAYTEAGDWAVIWDCLLYTSPSPRDRQKSRMPSSA